MPPAFSWYAYESWSMPYSRPFPKRRRNSPAWVPPVTSMISSIPAETTASIAQAIIGRS